MNRTDCLINDVIERFEGGYTNHPVDRGGPTNMGITRAALSDYLGRPASVDEVRTLTRTQAVAIYRSRYWNAAKIDLLPLPLQPVVFDTAVNMGPATAIRMLQQVLGDLGRPVPVDGVNGRRTTIAAIDAVAGLGAARVVDAVCDLRKQRYLDLVAADPSQTVFEAGWLKRCDSFRLSAGR